MSQEPDPQGSCSHGSGPTTPVEAQSEAQDSAARALPTPIASTITDKERLDYAWKHFALVADQRIKTFNFYVILLAGSFTGTVAALAQARIHREAFCLIGTAHMLIAAVFFVIDWRGCRILRVASDALVEIEASTAFAGHPRLMTEDRRRNKRGLWNFVSYRWAFLATFIVQFAFGLVLACNPPLLARAFTAAQP